MPDTTPSRQGAAGAELAAALRQTIARLKSLSHQDLPAASRQRVVRLLAEAEAGLSELELPEEW